MLQPPSKRARRTTCVGLAAVALTLSGRVGSVASAPVGGEPPLEVLRALGVTSEETRDLEAGGPVAKILSWGTPSEVYVFGAIHVAGAPDAYLKVMRDVARLATTPGYAGAGELHDTSTASDLATLKLEPDDVDALRSCHEGSCDVQLPGGTIEAFREQVDWSRSDADTQVNALARAMLLKLLRSYQAGGNRALGEYRDKKNPARVADEFDTMLARAAALPDLLPELRRYLLEYPSAPLPGSDSYFYWEKVQFGLKPTIRLNHAVIYRRRVKNRAVAAVAIKQLYATHYFHTALDVSVCAEDHDAGRPGFYLLTLKGSQQEGLTGLKGSLLRKVAVDRTRSSLQKSLVAIKALVERENSH